MLPSLASILIALGSLVVVLGLIVLSGRLLRATSLGAHRPGGRLARIETLALDPRRRLHLIACEGRSLLLLTGGEQDVVIGWLPGPEGRP